MSWWIDLPCSVESHPDFTLTLFCVHISPFSSTISTVLQGRDWKNSSESTTVPSSSRTRVRKWQDSMNTLAAWDPTQKETADPRTEDVTSSCLTSGVWCDLTCCSSSSRDDASRARRLLRLLVQTFRQRGWSEDRMWREMLVWTVDTDLPGERDRIHLHQTPCYPCGVNQYNQNL